MQMTYSLGLGSVIIYLLIIMTSIHIGFIRHIRTQVIGRISMEIMGLDGNDVNILKIIAYFMV